MYEQNYNRLELPEEALKTLKIKLKLGDNDTMGWIIDYLKHDRIALVRKIASTINSDNASNAIAYRDGALGRNDVLIKTLNEITQEKTYYDKLKQEKKTVT